MMTIHFKVEDTVIKPEDKEELKGIVRGHSNFVILKFSFDSSWNGFKKIISVSDISGHEILDGIDKTFIVPGEVTEDSIMRIQLFGNKDEEMFKTEIFYLNQK